MSISPEIAYCMNLDKRTDRWERVQQDFKRLQAVLPIKLERVSAVEELGCPQRGVARTVKKIIRIAKDRGLPYVLILEDDLFVIDPEKVERCLENPPEDWDILSGGAYYHVREEMWGEDWMRMKDFCSMHFIIIRETLYDYILNLKESAQHIDRNLGGQTKRGIIKTYIMHPMPCQQRPGFSNIRKKSVNDNRRRLPWIVHPDTLH
jgi:GR25 family glycosyltransferase involved in LPS biosynthesis